MTMVILFRTVSNETASPPFPHHQVHNTQWVAEERREDIHTQAEQLRTATQGRNPQGAKSLMKKKWGPE